MDHDMQPQSDGVDEAVALQVQTIISVAEQLAEQRARARDMALQQAKMREAQEYRQALERLAAERSVANIQLTMVQQNQWWVKLTPQELGYAYETAREWRELDPEAARMEEMMRHELESRYGVKFGDEPRDPNTPQDDRDFQATTMPEQSTETIPTSHSGRPDATIEQNTGERLPEDRKGMPYDSPERRTMLAEKLEAMGIDRDIIAVRLRADISQGRPATAAVAGISGARPPLAAPTPGRAVQRPVQRPGLGR